MSQPHDSGVATFSTALGWMAIQWRQAEVARLTFGHASPAAALKSLGTGAADAVCPQWVERLIGRLQAYSNGTRDDFRDVPVAVASARSFAARVRDRCRRIPYGKRATYGQIAAAAGSPSAARAVGNCMAKNPVPLIVPCHRVVAAGGRVGSFSAPGGAAMKRRLLAMESGE